MRHKGSYARLSATVELVLAPLSFLLYRLTRFCVQRLVQLDGRRPHARARSWQVLDGTAVRRPLNMLALMTSAPRWNTHALIALAGPLQVRHTLTIDASAAARSAASWTVVVHSEPAHRIVASIGSVDATGDGPLHRVSLPPGSYRLALRYYHWSAPVALPAVEVDGVPTVAAVAMSAGTNDFYHGLRERSSLFYVSLHSYVCTLLRHRRWFPRSFVAREYLPAGNPQTAFYYGYLAAGTRLDIDLGDDLLQTHDAYFTSYNRASLPVMWYPLTESRHCSSPSSVTGSYLIRVQARGIAGPAREPNRVRVQALPGAPEGAQTAD